MSVVSPDPKDTLAEARHHAVKLRNLWEKAGSALSGLLSALDALEQAGGGEAQSDSGGTAELSPVRSGEQFDPHRMSDGGDTAGKALGILLAHRKIKAEPVAHLLGIRARILRDIAPIIGQTGPGIPVLRQRNLEWAANELESAAAIIRRLSNTVSRTAQDLFNEDALDKLRVALLMIRDHDQGDGWASGVAMSALASIDELSTTVSSQDPAKPEPPKASAVSAPPPSVEALGSRAESLGGTAGAVPGSERRKDVNISKDEIWQLYHDTEKELAAAQKLVESKTTTSQDALAAAVRYIAEARKVLTLWVGRYTTDNA